MSSLADEATLIFETLDSLAILVRKFVVMASNHVIVIPKPVPPSPPVIPSGFTPTPKPFTLQQCVLISKIIDEKPGSELDILILSSNDFEILKHNDHVFTVIPPNPATFQAVPTIGITELDIWIKANSITPVPDVPADDA